MDIHAWLELALLVGLLGLLTKPIGAHLARVLDPDGRTFLDRPLKPVERFLYKVLGIDPRREQSWKRYAASLLLFSLAGLVLTYAILRLQRVLPFNPRQAGPMRPDLAFNTAVSFATNTNWQNYTGETALSYFSQAVGLVFQQFASAAAGLAAAAALVRGLARKSAGTVGNFWVDLVRVNVYLLLPLSLALALFLGSQGVIQNLSPPVQARTVEAGRVQIIAQGPVASQTAIKMLGTNGGGFFNANAAHPYENPTPLSNFLQVLALLLIPAGLTAYFGRTVGDRKHGWTVWAAMALLFVVGVVAAASAERAGNPRWTPAGISPAAGNMEGKEVRFGAFDSALFATATTAASCGAVNAMHDSFSPLGGLVPLFNIQMGEVVFGGVGSGLTGMIVFIVLAIFLTGLMTGRTPEYLGKKIDMADVRLSVLAVLVPIFAILGFSAWAAASPAAAASLGNGGPHGLSEILYAFSSGAGNNGSAFAGLSGDTPFFNLTLAAAMLAGRFLVLVPILALAGNMARKKAVASGAAAFPASGLTFGLILVATILIVGALTFLPALALGPVVEHFLRTGSAALY